MILYWPDPFGLNLPKEGPCRHLDVFWRRSKGDDHTFGIMGDRDFLIRRVGDNNDLDRKSVV